MNTILLTYAKVHKIIELSKFLTKNPSKGRNIHFKRKVELLAATKKGSKGILKKIFFFGYYNSMSILLQVTEGDGAPEHNW